MAGFGGLTVSAGLGVSAGFDGASTRDFSVTAACDFRAASVCDFGLVGACAAVLFVFAGASALALLVSLRFDSAAAALTGLRAVAVLRAAVLVVVFVGIKFTHGRLVRPRTMLLRGRRLLMNGLMNLTRLRLIHGKNFDQVLDRGVTQAFEISEAGFDERKRLLLRNRQSGR